MGGCTLGMKTVNPSIQVKSCCHGDSSIVENEKTIHKNIWKLGLALVLAGQMMVIGLGMNLSMPEYGSFPYKFLHGFLIVGSLLIMGLLGGDLFNLSWRNIKKGKIAVEGLFLLSMIGAFVGSILATVKGVGAIYYEVVAIVLSIYTIGKFLGQRSRSKVIQAAEKLKDEFNYAYVLEGEKVRQKVAVDQLTCCSQVSVGPGEAISVDGIILQGEGSVKETAMTGELASVYKKRGDTVWSGSYCVNGIFVIKPLAKKGQRKLDFLIKTIEEAQLKPSLLQEQANVIMQWFLPLVVTAAVGTFLYWACKITWDSALMHSMAVLLVACPCAIGLATPVAVWSGLWRLSTLGIISKSAEILDVLAKADRVVFDKTGTLSDGALVVDQFQFFSNSFVSEEELKAMVKFTETHIDHPVAKAISQIAADPSCQFSIIHFKLQEGKGISVQIKRCSDGKIMNAHLGDMRWIVKEVVGETRKIHALKSVTPEGQIMGRVVGRIIGIAVEKELCGQVILRERMKENLKDVFAELGKLNVKTNVLTGDNSIEHSKLEELDGIHVEGGLTPEDKLRAIEKYQTQGEKVLFVGDGLNDAVAMARSDGSLAINTGPALTQVVASGILVGEDMRVVPLAIEICRKLRQKVRGNILFAAVYNCIGMSLAAMGILHPVVAACLMLFSSAVVSVRAVKV